MTNQQAPEIYTLHTVLNKGERPWSGIYGVRADAEHDAKVMRDATGRDWSVVRLVVADTAATPTGPIARYKIGYATDDWGMRSSTPSGIPDHAGAWVRYEDHAAVITALRTPQPTQAQAGAVPLTCEWAHNENDGFWESACGEAWRFDDGGPAENSLHFCHSCGKSLRIKGKEAGNADA